MKGCCSIIPQIKVNRDGVTKEEDSKLFSSLWNLSKNREKVKALYATLNQENIKNSGRYKLNDQGEVSFESLVENMDLQAYFDLVEDTHTVAVEENLVNHDGIPKEVSSIEEAINKIDELNKKYDEFTFSLENTNDKKTIIQISDSLHASEAKNKILFDKELNNRILTLMNNAGFDISLDEAVETGVFDPKNARKTKEGLIEIIRLAKGNAGEKKLPEEFAHFAIGGLKHHPLVQRLLDQLQSPQKVKEILGTQYNMYYAKYKGKEELLRKEAAGQLVARYVENPEAMANPLAQRTWGVIKENITKITEEDLNNAELAAEETAYLLSKAIMEEDIYSIFDTEAVLNEDTLYSLSNTSSQCSKMEKWANEAKNLTAKKLAIEKANSAQRRYNKESYKSFKELTSKIENFEYAEACYSFLSNCCNQLTDLNKQLKEIQKNNIPAKEINAMAGFLIEAKNFLEGYSSIIEDMCLIRLKAEQGEFKYTDENGVEHDIDPDVVAQIEEQANNVDKVMKEMRDNYKKQRFNLSVAFIKPFFSAKALSHLGNGDPDVANQLEDLLRRAPKDINAVDTWIDAMGDSQDLILQAMNVIYKKSMNRRDKVMAELLPKIRAIHANFKGNTSFMFKKDANGQPTGYLISDIDYNKFYAERRAFIKSLDPEMKYRDKLKAIEEWENERMEEVVIGNDPELQPDEQRREKRPKKSLYPADDLKYLTPAQREYYDAMIELKQIADSMLPENQTKTHRAIYMHTSMINHIQNSKGSIKEKAKGALELLKREVVRSEDDMEFGSEEDGDVRNIVLDFKDNPVKKVPVHYTRKLEDMSLLNQDFTSAIVSYLGMAINFNEMNKINHSFELLRDLMHERDVTQTSGGSVLEESFQVAKETFNKVFTKKGDTSNIIKKMDAWMDKVLYDMGKKDEGEFNVGKNKVSVAKAADTLKAFNSTLGLGFNAVSGVVNLLQGHIQMMIEAGGDYFSMKDFIKSKAIYHKLLPAFAAEINSSNKTSLLAMLNDRFDPTQDFYQQKTHENYSNSAFVRAVGNNSQFVFNESGEFALHNRVMLAMMNNIKVVNEQTKQEKTLLEIFSVKKETADGLTYPILKVEEGYTLKDSKVKINEDYLDNFKNQLWEVNTQLFGAFHEADKGLAHRFSLGRLVGQYRQWMPKFYLRRFGKARYNLLLDKEIEGYHRTFVKLMWNTMKDMRNAKFNLVTNYKNLTDSQKANIWRAVREFAIYIGLITLVHLLGAIKDSKGFFAKRWAQYTARRLKLELGAGLPIPQSAENIFTIIKSPAACVNTLEHITKLAKFNLLFSEKMSGRYEGMNEYLINALYLIPYQNNIRKAFDIGVENYAFSLFPD